MLPSFDPWLAGTVAADVWMASHAAPVALEARRARRLAALLEAAAQRSPLYRRVLAGRDVRRTRLEELPVAHKAELMRHFADWVGDPGIDLAALRRFTADPAQIGGAFPSGCTVWESSGSSGEPAVFVQDAGAMAVYDALEAVRRPQLRPGRSPLDFWSAGGRVAFVGAIGGHFASTVSMERLRRLNPALAATLRGISFLQPLDRLVAEIDAWAPAVIATYPSAAVLLAEERRAGRLQTVPLEIWTGGETLSAPTRRGIEQGFGCPVANNYGASEFLTIASECRRGGLHLNSDWVILEPVDERGRPVPPGVTGATTLLTNLANPLQPLIRYDLGDCVTVHPEPCGCGSHLPVIDVEGRSDDTLRLGTGRRPVRVLALALTTILEDEAGLFDFQLVQESASTLLLRSAAHGREAAARLRRGRVALAHFLERQGAPSIRIHCRCGEPPALGRSGKARRVVAAPP
jgi:phenylacetate-coenzyme A ligase PaaK-like adenylate-forming protein